MGLRNVSNLFDYVNDSLENDYKDWATSWKGWATDNNTHFNETEDGYSFYLALAGLTKDDVKVNIVDDYIGVHAKGTSAEREVEYKKSFSIPTKADKETLEAKMENGMLSITISKREKDKNKTVEIK